MLKFIFGLATGVLTMTGTAIGWNIATDVTNGNIIAGSLGAGVGFFATSVFNGFVGHAIGVHDAYETRGEKKVRGAGAIAGAIVGGLMWANGAFAEEITPSPVETPNPIIETFTP